MPRPHIAMRKIREVIRLTFGRGHEPAPGRAPRLGVPSTTVADHVRRIRDAGLDLAAAR